MIRWTWVALVGCGPREEPEPTTPTTTTTTTESDTGTLPPPTGDDDDDDTAPPAERRWDCSGMDPADEAPVGKIVLTFDDGPDPIDTPAILDVLREYGIPATFFVLGANLSEPENWPIAEEIVDDPLFDLGNHTWDHVDLADASDATVAAQMDDTAALLDTFDPSWRFFRFPYGSSTCDTHDAATDRGWLVTGWHIDTADWCYAANGGSCSTDDYWRVPEEYETDMIGLSMEQIRRFDGGVVLFHDIHGFTADSLRPFIEAALAEGYTFARLDDEAVLPNLNAGTPVDLPYLGEACQPSNDRCWQVEHEAWCEPTAPDDPQSDDGICTLPCEGTCLDRDGAATTFCADVGGAGQCVGRSDAINAYCDDLPGTSELPFDRFVGSSSAADAVVDVCAPAHW